MHGPLFFASSFLCVMPLRRFFDAIHAVFLFDDRSLAVSPALRCVFSFFPLF